MLDFYGEVLLAPHPTSELEGCPLSLSATAYSVYSQPSSTSGGFLHLETEDIPCCGDKEPTWVHYVTFRRCL